MKKQEREWVWLLGEEPYRNGFPLVFIRFHWHAFPHGFFLFPIHFHLFFKCWVLPTRLHWRQHHHDFGGCYSHFALVIPPSFVSNSVLLMRWLNRLRSIKSGTKWSKSFVIITRFIVRFVLCPITFRLIVARSINGANCLFFRSNFSKNVVRLPRIHLNLMERRRIWTGSRLINQNWPIPKWD